MKRIYSGDAHVPIGRGEIVEAFWTDVWVARNPEAVDRYVVEDFTLTTGGVASSVDCGVAHTAAPQ